VSFEWKTFFFKAGRPILWAIVLSILPFILFLYFLVVETVSLLSNNDDSGRFHFEGSYESVIITIKVFVGSYTGAFIGDKLREFAFPDGIATTGFIGTIISRIFWLIGPQLVGCVIVVVSLFWWGGVTADSTPTLLEASLAVATALIAKREYRLFKERSRYFSFRPSFFSQAILWLKENWGIIAVVVAVVLLFERFERTNTAAVDANDTAESQASTADSLMPPQVSSNDQIWSNNLEEKTENPGVSEASSADQSDENNIEPRENDSESVDEQFGIKMIREGRFDRCAKASVGELFDNAFYNPKWEVNRSDEVDRFVVFTGFTEDRDDSPRVVMRFSYPIDSRWKVIDVFQDGEQKDIGKSIERVCEIF
jgi:hypothetical protein